METLQVEYLLLDLRLIFDIMISKKYITYQWKINMDNLIVEKKLVSVNMWAG